jgi:hypothetical protein
MQHVEAFLLHTHYFPRIAINIFITKGAVHLLVLLARFQRPACRMQARGRSHKGPAWSWLLISNLQHPPRRSLARPRFSCHANSGNFRMAGTHISARHQNFDSRLSRWFETTEAPWCRESSACLSKSKLGMSGVLGGGCEKADRQASNRNKARLEIPVTYSKQRLGPSLIATISGDRRSRILHQKP